VFCQKELTLMKIRCSIYFFFLSIFFIILGCGPKPQVFESVSLLNILQKELDQIYSDPAFDTATWGVVIQSLENGEYFYRRNENKGFMPASNMKLFTTAVALLKLGPEFRW